MNDISTPRAYRCDLNHGTCIVNLKAPLMHQDALADVFRVAVCRANVPVDLAGMGVTGYLYYASTRQTLLLQGTTDGHYASVALSSPCYATPGYASLVIQLQDGDARHTLLKANFCIDRTGTESVLDPDDVLPSLPDLLGQIETLRAVTAQGKEVIADIQADADAAIARTDEAAAAADAAAQAAEAAGQEAVRIAREASQPAIAASQEAAQSAEAAARSAQEAAATLASVQETVTQETAQAVETIAACEAEAVEAVAQQQTASVQAVHLAAQTAAAQQEEAIAAKGQETLASIPDDYTQLGQDVAALTEEIDELTSDVDNIAQQVNYFDANEVKAGNFNAAGDVIESTSYFYTPYYIRVPQDKTHFSIQRAVGATNPERTLAGFRWIVAYDGDGAVVGVANGTSEPFNTDKYYEIPSNCKYIRLSFTVSILNATNVDFVFTKDIQDHVEFGDMYLSGKIKNVPSKVSELANDEGYLSLRDNILYGKRVSFLGDSLTYLGDAYINAVKTNLKLADALNCGIGGTYVSGSSAECFWQDARVNSLLIDGDAVIVMGGTNDSSFRTVTDADFTIDNCNTDNFVGAYNVLLSKLYYKYLKLDAGYYADISYSGVTQPSVAVDDFKIILVTPPKRFDTDQHRQNADAFAEYVMRIGAMWGIPVVNANQEMGMNAFNKELMFTRPSPQTTDYLHFNAVAYGRLTDCVCGKIKSLR